MINLSQSLCLFGGISRSLGMVSYRSIKTEVDPVTVVLLHSALSCVVSVPLMGTVSFENNVFFMQTLLSNPNYSSDSKAGLAFNCRSLGLFRRSVRNSYNSNIQLQCCREVYIAWVSIYCTEHWYNRFRFILIIYTFWPWALRSQYFYQRIIDGQVPQSSCNVLRLSLIFKVLYLSFEYFKRLC